MVAEPWILKMGNQVSTNLKHVLHLETIKKQGKPQQERQIIGILCFEVANVMSKVIHLHKSLTDNEIFKLKNEILKFEGIKTLVCSDEKQLLELTLLEKLDDLNRVSSVVSRLGKKCTKNVALQGFEHVYGDIVLGVIDVKELGFLVKDMDHMVRKMERYVNSTASLYGEMEVMNEIEVATKKFEQNQHEESRKAFEQKLSWQKEDVNHLKDVSLWNQSYDKVVELLARTICTIYARIQVVLGDPVSKSQLGASGSLRRVGEVERGSGLVKSVSVKSNGRVTIVKKGSERRTASLKPNDFNLSCDMGPGRLFFECLSLSTSASKVEDDDYDDHSSQNSGVFGVPSHVKREYPIPINGSRIGLRSTLTVYAPPNTVGGSALALHYANVIIVIEKFLRYPHLVGDEARDDLYQMLPTSLRKTLKTKLKSYVKDLDIYDAPLAHEWRERLSLKLKWLAPLAHNMIRWQSERNFEQQQILTRTNVLLLQTLYFADRVKIEGAICELLVGLNYICRYEQQQNALLDCASSFDFEDCMEWQSQLGSSFYS